MIAPPPVTARRTPGRFELLSANAYADLDLLHVRSR